MTYTIKLNDEQVIKIKTKYQKYKLPLTTAYMIFRAKLKMTTLTIFQTNKLLIQGSDYEVYQEICDFLNIKNIVANPNEDLKLPLSIIGTDEVGTGDYFGGIVVCGCFIEKNQILEIRKLGIKDSKKISDSKINILAPQLIKKLHHRVIYLNNEKYNAISKEFKANLNKIKAILHNKVLINLLECNLKYDKIVIDGFTTKEKYLKYLQNQKKIIDNVYLEEKGEDKYLAVAASSIIARYFFLKKLHELSKKYQYNLPKGAGKEVDLMIHQIIKDQKKDILNYIAKLNFKNTKKSLF